MNMMVKIIPKPNDYDIMGLIHKLNDSDYIITDNDGEIDTLGERLSDMLEIKPSKLKETLINI